MIPILFGPVACLTLAFPFPFSFPPLAFSQIIEGSLLLVHEDKVYKVNAWLMSHPGGEQLMLHFIGRDATDNINVSHDRKTVEKKMKPFYVGDLADSELGQYRSLLPPSLLGFHPVLAGKGKPVTWVQEGDTRAFLEGRERLAEASSSSGEVASPAFRTRTTPHLPAPTLLLSDLYPPAPQPFTALEAQAAVHFKELSVIIDKSGLMAAPKYASGYSVELVRYAALLAVFGSCWYGGVYGGVGSAPGEGWKQALIIWVSAVALGVFWHIMSFTAHDIGHRSLANGSYFWNNILGVLISDFMGGLSIGWWCHEHNIHHHMTNDLEHDPDVQQLPFLALNKGSLNNLWSTRYKEYKLFDKIAEYAVRVQHMTYYCLLSVGRFNLCILSYQHLAIYAHKDKMWAFELTCLAGFFTWFGGIILGQMPSWKLRAMFLVVSFMTASPLHLMIVQSHYSRSMEDMGVLESHMTKNLRTTMDILIHPFLRFYFGGLEHQTTHHLFPRMPRHNLKAATVIVKDWCIKNGYQFDSYGFVEGNKITLSVLKSVADQVKFMGIVAADSVDEMTKKGVAQAFTP
ncbi:fatty acid desaturase-domain-containing protein [Mrakia frigida]|uniref:fatty acid desaturase n=1 Tax=Mrakia frigida TaxID=29902 RepID=UPI003FCC0E1A